jgi:hypothetical protein
MQPYKEYQQKLKCKETSQLEGGISLSNSRWQHWKMKKPRDFFLIRLSRLVFLIIFFNLKKNLFVTKFVITSFYELYYRDNINDFTHYFEVKMCFEINVFDFHSNATKTSSPLVVDKKLSQQLNYSSLKSLIKQEWEGIFLLTFQFTPWISFD